MHRVLLIILASALAGCTSMAVADLAGRAMQHPGIDTINIRGGALYESPDLSLRFRPAGGS